MSTGIMVGVPGGRVDAKEGRTARVWVVQDRKTRLYRLPYGGWGVRADAVRHATEREAQTWWDFHGDDRLVWFKQL
jgi:hypothetical protein